MPRTRSPQQIQEQEHLKRVIAKAVRTARKRQGLSQAAVAMRLDITVQHYSSIDRGQTLPSVPLLFRLGVALETSPSQLLGKTDIEPATANTAHLRKPAGVMEETPSELIWVAELLSKASPETLQTVETILTALEQRAARLDDHEQPADS